MNSIIKALLRPYDNRHYTDKKTSAILYASKYIPSLLICLYAAVFTNAIFWILLGSIIVYGFVDYIVFDAFLDKMSWKYLWRHFYADEAGGLTPDQDVMKLYEKNPTPENYKKLQKVLNSK
jgi:hypothetical protein